MSLKESFLLGSRPISGQSVKWSEGNRIAVVSPSAVQIISPKCSGTRPMDNINFPRVTIKNDGKKKEWKKILKPTGKEVSDKMSMDLRSSQSPSISESFRAVDWSPLGCTDTHECFLAILSTSGKILIASSHYDPNVAEWTLVCDLSDNLEDYFTSIEDEPASADLENYNETSNLSEDALLRETPKPEKSYADILDSLETQCLAWSDVVHTDLGNFVYLAAGSKNGIVTVWGLDSSRLYKDPKAGVNRASFIFSGRLNLGNGWITTMTWKQFKPSSDLELILFIGTSDGEVRVYQCRAKVPPQSSSATGVPSILFSLMYCSENPLPGSIICMSCPRVTGREESGIKVAFATSGRISVLEFDNKKWICTQSCIEPSVSATPVEILWNYEGSKIVVLTLDGRCLLFSYQDDTLLLLLNESHELLRKIAAKDMYKLEQIENEDLRLLDKKIWGGAFSENDIYLTVCFSLEGLDEEGFRRTGNPQLEFFQVIQSTDPKVYAIMPKRIVHYVNYRGSRFQEEHYQSRTFLWDIIEFCRVDNFYDDDSSLYHVLMQSLMSIHSESNHAKLEDFKEFLREPNMDLKLIGFKLLDALYNERRMIALRYMSFIMYHLRYAIPDRFRSILENHLDSCIDELARTIIQLVMLTFFRVQTSMGPKGLDWTSIFLYRDWIIQNYRHQPELYELAIKVDEVFMELTPEVQQELIGMHVNDHSLSKTTSFPQIQSTNNSFSDIGAHETCPMCKKSILVKNHLKATCPDNHTWDRCSISFLINPSPYVRSCSGCFRKVLCVVHPRAPDEYLMKTPFVSWILGLVDRCIFCDNYFSHYF